jgi:hypothetical protein
VNPFPVIVPAAAAAGLCARWAAVPGRAAFWTGVAAGRLARTRQAIR